MAKKHQPLRADLKGDQRLADLEYIQRKGLVN